MARDDRNFLSRQKTHEQLAAEDPANRKIWGYDDKGDKVLLKDEDGQFIEEKPGAGAPEEEGE